MEIVQQNLIYIVIGEGVLLFFMFIALLKSFNDNKKIKQQYNEFFKFKTNESDFEEMLSNYLSKVTDIDERSKSIKEEIIKINSQLNTCVQKVDFFRYNPFQTVGGELSFVFTLLDSNNNGIIYNSIFAEDGCYSYGKEIVNGRSEIKLSNEENVSLNRALKK